jgi:hypothetical protein
LIHTLIPHTQRFSKKSASTSSTDPCCAYYKLIQGVSDLYELSVQENNSTLPPVSAKWSRDLIIGFVKLEAAIRPSKDKRVSYLGSALDIGAVNTLKVCKVSFVSVKKIEFYLSCTAEAAEGVRVV